MADETAAVRTISRCKLCLDDREMRRCEAPQWDVQTDADYLDVLTHVVETHPDEAAVAALFADVELLTPCAECGTPFASAICIGAAGLTMRAYCDPCVAQNALRQLIVRPVAPADVFEEVPRHGK